MNKYIMFKENYPTPNMVYVSKVKYRIYKENGVSYILRQTNYKTGKYTDYIISKNLENQAYTIGTIKGD